MKEAYCETCNAMRPTHVDNRAETFTVRNTEIRVETAARICESCGEIVFDSELDDAKLDQAYRQYRAQTGLLQPEEIRAIRETYALSQSAAAKLLGWSPVTFSRYETGSLQEPAHDELLRRLRDDRHWAHELFARNGSKLTKLQQLKLRQALESSELVVSSANTVLVDALNAVYHDLLYVAGEDGNIPCQRALEVVERQAEQAGIVLSHE